MGMPEFRQIIERYCRQAAIENSEAVIRGSPVAVHGCTVWLQYVNSADLCRVIVDLGVPDGGIPPDIWRMMLESNCTNNSRFLPFLALNPSDGHAILVLQMSLDMLRDESDFPKLLDEHLTPVVQTWRKTVEIIEASHSSGRSILSGDFA
jgi:hypothetical protein